jgi:hypothetical protein
MKVKIKRLHDAGISHGGATKMVWLDEVAT